MKNQSSEYQETIDFLFSQLPMYQRVGPKAFKKDLTNITRLCNALGNPQNNFKSIHIAGTNGKGSTTHLMAARCMKEPDWKVGIYCSPHYKDFRERIKIDGEPVPKSYVIAFVKKHRTLLENIRPSFFEISVAMAFSYFNTKQVDIAIIEVGLGGRLDSTNIITPLLSIITNISKDHTNFLGDTLELIAGEKAGIIKSGIPVVIGERHPDTEEVFRRKAIKEQAPISFADEILELECTSSSADSAQYKIKYDQDDVRSFRTDMTGPFQDKNLRTALAAIHILEGRGHLSQMSNGSGWESVKRDTYFIGRWQILQQHPMILADSGHNEGALSNTLKELERNRFSHIHFVLGFVNDKELNNILDLFPRENATYYFTQANIPRALDAGALLEKATLFSLTGNAYASPQDALKEATVQADENDLIFIGGSTFLVAELI